VVFVLSVSELSKNRQRRYVVSFFTSDLQVAYKFHFGETCSHLVQATCVARDWGIGHARVHHHTATHNNQQKTTTTHNRYSATGPWPMPPPSSPGDKLIKICYKNSSTGARSTSHAPVTWITSIESATSTSALETVITFDATSEVTRDPMISRTT